MSRCKSDELQLMSKRAELFFVLNRSIRSMVGRMEGKEGMEGKGGISPFPYVSPRCSLEELSISA